MNRRRIGFSEILAILGGVLLLSTIALPLMMRNQDASRSVACMRNLKQIGAAVLLYAEDQDNLMPSTTEKKPRLGFGMHWSRIVQPYLASLEAFVCPADGEPAHATFREHSIDGQVPLLSYINNYAVIPAHDFYPVPQFTFTAPEQVIMIGERRAKTYMIGSLPAWKGTSGFFPGQPCSDQLFGTGYIRTDAGQARRALRDADRDDQLLLIRLNWNMHGRGSNYTFADGHAAFEVLDRTLDPQRFQWGERFYPRSKPDADCDGHARKKTPARPAPI